MLLAQEFRDLCEKHDTMKLFRQFNSKIWFEGELERLVECLRTRESFQPNATPDVIQYEELTRELTGVPTVEEELANDPLGSDWSDSFSATQSLVESISSTVSTHELFDKASLDWVSHIENLMLYAHSLYHCDSFGDVVLETTKFMKMCTHQSIVQTVLGVMDTLGSDNFRPCAPDDVPKEPERSNKLENLRSNWKLFKTNTIFKKFSFLLSAALSVFACEKKGIEWNLYGIEILSVKAFEKQVNAIDLLDAIIETTTWMFKTGVMVIKEKSLYPILYSNDNMVKFNKECDYVFAHIDSVVAGNYTGDVQEFERKVDECLVGIQRLRDCKTEGPTVSWLQDRFTRLVDVKQKLISQHKSATQRFFPIGFAITGDSQIGKTGLAGLVTHTALGSMGFSTAKKFQRTRNWNQAHDSEVKSDILAFLYDEIGAAKAQFVSRSEAAAFVQEMNGVPLCANMADLSSKGNIFFNHKVGVATSNFYDLNFSQYTDYPAAALNRLIFMRVEVREKYRAPGTLSLNTDHPDFEGKSYGEVDAWNIKLEKVYLYKTSSGETRHRFAPFKVKVDGTELSTENLNIITTLKMISILSKAHKKRQEKILESAGFLDKQGTCGCCGIPSYLCPSKDVSKDSFRPCALDFLKEAIVDSATSGVKTAVSNIIAPAQWWNFIIGYAPLKKYTSHQLSSAMEGLVYEVAGKALARIVPHWIHDSHYYQVLVNKWQKTAAMHDVTRHFQIAAIIVLYMTYAYWNDRTYVSLFASCFFSFIAIFGAWFAYNMRLAAIRREYCRHQEALPNYVEMQYKWQIGTSVAVAGTVLLVKSLNMWNKHRLKPNSSEEKPKEETIDQDKSPGWMGFVMQSLGLQVKTDPLAKYRSTQDMISAFEKNNLFWCDVDKGNVMTSCNAFFPQTQVCLMPEHILHLNGDMTQPKLDTVTMCVDRHDRSGSKIKFKVDKTCYVKIPGVDMVMIYVPRCPSLAPRYQWLPQSLPVGSCPAHLLARIRSGGDVHYYDDKIHVEFGVTGHTYGTFYGGQYDSDLSIVGACMGLVVPDTKTPSILGFHIGGKKGKNKDDRRKGAMQTLTREMYDEALQRLCQLPHVHISADKGEIPKYQLGERVLDSEGIHPNSMTARLTKEASLEVLGSTKLRAKMKSTVEQSILSPHVKEVCGVENNWGPPKLQPNWAAYNATLEHVINPAKPFAPADVNRAIDDYMYGKGEGGVSLADLARKSDMRVLSDKEAILGIPGKRFLEALKMSTSMGFPIFGKKSKWFSEIWEDGVLKDRIPDPLVKEELDRLKECWKRGERAYPVTSATLKDEPTELGKEKVRVFQAAPVCMSIMIRKYFLPIARFLSTHPIMSECAVGVNAFSQDWEKLMSHCTKYNMQKVLAWDYKKFDVRMGSEITTSVWGMFIEFARLSGGYSEEDLYIMRMMIKDITDPLMDWNGTLVIAFSMNTSGNNLTVNVNSVAGSLYVRMGFFHIYADRIPAANLNFRDFVAALTYGDDFKGSVKPDYEDFNFETFQKFLAEHDITITVPDKSDAVIQFMDEEDADFLKRVSSYIPEIGVSIGKLSENSIWKSLHSNLRSRTCTKTEVALSCLECAMHEWFAYGRDHYEMRRQQMLEVCKRADLVPSPAVLKTFDERVEHWKSKYCENT
jgi:hypothetical protein